MKQVLFNGDVGKGGMDILMAKICREERQPVLRIDARAVPFEDTVHDHRVAQIVDSRPAPIPTESLRLAQTERLRDDGEVVSGLAVPQSMPVVIAEERAGRCSEEPHAFETIDAQPV